MQAISIPMQAINASQMASIGGGWATPFWHWPSPRATRIVYELIYSSPPQKIEKPPVVPLG